MRHTLDGCFWAFIQALTPWAGFLRAGPLPLLAVLSWALSQPWLPLLAVLLWALSQPWSPLLAPLLPRPALLWVPDQALLARKAPPLLLALSGWAPEQESRALLAPRVWQARLLSAQRLQWPLQHHKAFCQTLTIQHKYCEIVQCHCCARMTIA